jgi:hypothetical protein
VTAKLERVILASQLEESGDLTEDELNRLWVDAGDVEDLGEIGEEVEEEDEEEEDGGGRESEAAETHVDYSKEVDWLVGNWEERIMTGIRYLAKVCYPHVPSAEAVVVSSFLTYRSQDSITSTPLRIDADNNSNSCNSNSKNKSSSFSFWESILTLAANNTNHLLLANIAKTVFCTCASEAPCERIFSRLKLLIGDRRRKLIATTAFYLLLLTF